MLLRVCIFYLLSERLGGCKYPAMKDKLMSLLLKSKYWTTAHYDSQTVQPCKPYRTPLHAANMKIAAFNIQKFGRRKVSDPEVLNVLVKIISRYDIIVILEVVDAKGKSVETLKQALNKANPKKPYTLKISTRLGRSHYREQFLFFY
ncbi:hypothetical protein XENORESO_006975, partial [Xenotaenia resolanae]